jgi:hypothetical protein
MSINSNLNSSEINLQLIPYKTNNRSNIKRYHIVNSNGNIIKYKIYNVYSNFGRQTTNDHKTSMLLKQHRLNISFSLSLIENQDKSYLELNKLITELETYFKLIDDFSDYELISNIINRDIYGLIMRFHLKTNKDNTITPLILIKDNTYEQTEWISFNKNIQFNLNFHPDCLWVDEINKKFGISLVVDKVFQLYTNK